MYIFQVFSIFFACSPTAVRKNTPFPPKNTQNQAILTILSHLISKKNGLEINLVLKKGQRKA